MPHLLAQISKLFRSCCRIVWSELFLMRRYSRQSSANSRTVDFTLSGRSLMLQRNVSGPSTVPWGTPESTDVSLLDSPSTIVLMVRVVRKLVNHEWIVP